MGKRYSDSEQFTDPWFRKLSPECKLFWVYLCSACDNSGVWERDDEYALWLTSLNGSVDQYLKELGDRAISLSENKVLLPKFIFFQQGGMLTESKPPHRGILKLLDKHGLEMNADCMTIAIGGQSKGKGKAKVSQSKGKGKAKVNQTVTKSLVTSNSNSNGNSNGKDKEGSVRETIPSLPPQLSDTEFLQAWSEWTAYRKERRLPALKPMALKAQRSMLADWVDAHGLPAVISSMRNSIANNWQGLFEPRSNQLTKENHDDADYDSPLDL